MPDYLTIVDGIAVVLDVLHVARRASIGYRMDYINGPRCPVYGHEAIPSKSESLGMESNTSAMTR